jgi:hypothetical protein
MQRLNAQQVAMAKSQRPSLLRGYRRIRKPGKYQGLAGKYQKAIDEANAKNEARYNQMLTGYDDLHKRVTGDLANTGAMERKDITRQYNSMGSDIYQRLVNRGFGNSSLHGTMRMGVERERSDAMARSYERAAQLRAQADMNITQGKMGVIERRTDIGPDPQQLLQLSQGLGRSGYGRRPMYGQPIGMNPMALQNSYQQMLMQHMGGMPAMGGPAGRSPYQMARVQNARAMRASRGPRPRYRPRVPARPIVLPADARRPVDVRGIA